jgi:hypothetical protein
MYIKYRLKSECKVPKLIAYKGKNKFIEKECVDLEFLIERGIAFNEFMCLIDEIYSLEQWIERTKKHYTARYWVESEGELYMCEPKVIPKRIIR